MIVSVLGIALLQTFRNKNLDEKPDRNHFAFRPSISWVITLTEGLLVFSYGFLGFWLSDRKRYFWRINLSCKTRYKRSNIDSLVAAQVFMTLLTVILVVVIIIFDSEKATNRLVWSTFIVLGFLL